MTESFTIFLMFLGVILESEICVRLTTAFASLASFSCCFLSFALIERAPGFETWFDGIKCFSQRAVFNTSRVVAGVMSSSSRDRMKLAAELVSKGATMLAEPCPKDGGIQVRYRGKVYCTTHDDLTSITMASAVSYDAVVGQLREVLLERLNETTAALGTERELAKQDQLVSLATKYFALLQRLPLK